MRNVLIALVGMSPAVVTETIWALAHDPETPCMPDELVLITTLAGKQEIERHLAPPKASSPSKLRQMAKALRDKQLEPLFAPVGPAMRMQVICPKADDAVVHTDAHDADELDHMGDLIFRTVKSFTDQQDTRVILSISGGRKSMGHLGGSAMTLLARAQDMMCHVLVTPAWLERCDGYYFPDDGKSFTNTQPESGESHSVQGECTAVTLSCVPFVRLNHYPSVLNLMGRLDDLGFAGIIDSINSANTPGGGKVLVVDWAANTVKIDGLDLKVKYPAMAEQAVAYLVMLGLGRKLRSTLADDDLLLLLRVSRIVDFRFYGKTIAADRARLNRRADEVFERRPGENDGFTWPESEAEPLDCTRFFKAYLRTSELSKDVPAGQGSATHSVSPQKKLKFKRQGNMQPILSNWRTAIFKTMGELQPYRIPNATQFYEMPAALTLDTGDEPFAFIPRPTS